VKLTGNGEKALEESTTTKTRVEGVSQDYTKMKWYL